VLPRAEFIQLVDESALARRVLHGVADSRLAENRQSRERGC
jgi:hypothetical protein